MSLASLHSICLHRIYGFLKEGTWKFCKINPFSELPDQDAQKLIEMTLLYRSEEHPPKIGDVILLLTSGRLIRLDLCPFYPEKEQDLIAKVMQTIASSMRNYASHSKEHFIFHLVRNITSRNPNLKEFHSPIHPGFDVFRNSQNLRILKLYDSYFRDLRIANLPVAFSVLSSLRNLEVLHLPYMDTDTKANVLEICPKLISIGLTDSLDSMEEIHQRRLKNPLLNCAVRTHFQLRRCVWSYNLRGRYHHERRVYYSRFCDKIRFAVTLCPLVQELILYVHVKEALKELRFLKQLTLLRIDFNEYEGDFVREFVALLQEIGPQLNHLSIIWKYPCVEYVGVPIDAVCDCCPHLESLEIDQFAFEPGVSSGVSRNLPLKRLTLRELWKRDSESLLLLLSNCKHLEELFLGEVAGLDDALLSQIFERNPLTELKVIFVEGCSLTREGYQMFMEKASSIETVFIDAYEENYFYDANRVFKDPNLRYLEDAYAYVKLREFFYCRLNENRF